MSDNNPRLRNWLDQVEQSKYQSDHRNNSSQRSNVIYHVLQNQPTMIYVGFWRRLFAKFIDWVTVHIPSFFIFIFLSQPQFGLGLFPVLIWLLTWFFYHTMLPSSKLQGTIGKLAVGALIKNNRNEQLSYSNAVGRFFASILSGGIFFIGYVMVASNPKKRGLHDMMADTYVMNK